ncbi:MAG: hypothetical protein ACK40G_17480 [Cytophagaceae bacterium]
MEDKLKNEIERAHLDISFLLGVIRTNSSVTVKSDEIALQQKKDKLKKLEEMLKELSQKD